MLRIKADFGTQISITRSSLNLRCNMAFKFVLLAGFLAAANAGLVPVGAPLAYAAHAAPVLPQHNLLGYAAGPAPVLAHAAPLAKEVDPNYDPHPQYSYSYDVQDGLTGDNKQHQESRDGDLVHGSFSLVEADGTRRIVDYTADSLNGFNAVVRKEPAVKAIPAIPAAYAAAPVAYKTYVH